MGTTTNNGWPTPVATDLVKDGWEAIKDLGDAIDTTLGVYSPATPMGVHLSTVTFSGVASQSFSDVFSSIYDTYKIVASGITGTSTPYDLRLRFRDSGGDISTANYQSKQIFGQPSSTTAAENGGNNTAQTSSTLIFGGAVFNGDINVFRPNLAAITSYTLTGDYAVGGYFVGSGTFGLTTQLTGFSLLASTGNFSGTVSVFGFNK